MKIEKIYRKNLKLKKPGWRFDKNKNEWSSYKIDITIRGKRHRKSGFRTKSAAEKYIDDLLIADRLDEIGIMQRQDYPPIGELFNKRFKDIRLQNEISRATRVFKVFEQLHGKTTPINKISKKHFKDFAEFRLNEDVTAATVNREITVLQSAFSKATFYFEIKNWRPPEVYKIPKADNPRSRVISETEYHKLLKYFEQPKFEREMRHYNARRRVGLIFQFLLMTGLRHGEVCGIKRSDYNPEKRELNVFRFKTNRYKLFSPLTETHIYLLNEGKNLHPDSDYFFSLEGKINYKNYRIFKKACKSLDIPYGKKTKGGLIFHDLRHSFSTVLHSNLIDNKTITEFTDNPSSVTSYQHSTELQKIKAMQIIEKKFGIDSDNSAELKKVYDQIKTGEMDFAGFANAVSLKSVNFLP